MDRRLSVDFQGRFIVFNNSIIGNIVRTFLVAERG